MQILFAEQSDLPIILDLQYAAYQSEARLLNNPNIPPLLQTLEELQNEFERGTILKAVDDDGSIIGSVRSYAKDGTLYIGKLIVQPDRQGKRIGTALLHEIERACQQDRYELFTSSISVRNIKLYERAGYRIFREQQISENLKFIYLEKVFNRLDC